MSFGQKIRSLREARNLGQFDLAEKVRARFNYISKIEIERLDFGVYPSEELILRLVKALKPKPTSCCCWPDRSRHRSGSG